VVVSVLARVVVTLPPVARRLLLVAVAVVLTIGVAGLVNTTTGTARVAPGVDTLFLEPGPHPRRQRELGGTWAGRWSRVRQGSKRATA